MHGHAGSSTWTRLGDIRYPHNTSSLIIPLETHMVVLESVLSLIFPNAQQKDAKGSPLTLGVWG